MKYLNLILLIGSLLFLSSCNDEKSHSEAGIIHFATSAEYPPFEYQSKGVLQGFDIDLANLIASKLGKKAVFDNMQFSSVLPALSSHQVDAAISTFTITAERKKNFDFSDPYYFEGLAVVFKKETPNTTIQQLSGKKIAVQLGSTMELWLKKNAPDSEIVTMDNNNQTIAALKAGHVDAVCLDGAQAGSFSQKNLELSFAIIAKSEDGYGIALNKNSPLTAEINTVLKMLKNSGELDQLKTKWLGAAK